MDWGQAHSNASAFNALRSEVRAPAKTGETNLLFLSFSQTAVESLLNCRCYPSKTTRRYIACQLLPQETSEESREERRTSLPHAFACRAREMVFRHGKLACKLHPLPCTGDTQKGPGVRARQPRRYGWSTRRSQSFLDRRKKAVQRGSGMKRIEQHRRAYPLREPARTRTLALAASC